MKRKEHFVAIAVLSAVMVSLTVSSCSPEYTEEELNDYSLSKKEKIERLAEEYGLSIELNDNISFTSRSLKEFEEDFCSMHSLMGDYVLFPVERDGKDMLQFLKKESLICYSAPSPSSEPHSWSDQKTNSEFKFSVLLTWELDSLGNATSHTFSASMEDKDDPNGGTCYLSQKNSHILGRGIYFSTNITFEYLNDTIKYYFALSGFCNYDTSLGEFNFGTPIF